MAKEGKKYEENFNQLKAIAEELSHQEISIDEVISKGKKAAEAANCINILKTEKGSFKKLEEELLSISEEVDEILEEEEDNENDEDDDK